jgi:ubiquinol-cytochrome c reductase cytochrome b subunit
MGIALFLTLILQLASGLFLASYYVPEPGLVIEFREEMFSDVWFSREVFYSHVWGVDVLFVLSYLHILKKVFDKNYILCEAEG